MYAWDVICDIYLMQSEYVHDSREWKRERASLNARIQQLERELVAFRMDHDDEEHWPDGGDAWVDSALSYDGDYGRCSCLGG